MTKQELENSIRDLQSAVSYIHDRITSVQRDNATARDLFSNRLHDMSKRLESLEEFKTIVFVIVVGGLSLSVLVLALYGLSQLIG